MHPNIDLRLRVTLALPVPYRRRTFGVPPQNVLNGTGNEAYSTKKHQHIQQRERTFVRDRGDNRLLACVLHLSVHVTLWSAFVVRSIY